MILTKDEKMQIQFLKSKTPSDRFRLMTELIDSQIKAMKSGILLKNPDISKQEVENCLKTRLMKIYSLKH